MKNFNCVYYSIKMPKKLLLLWKRSPYMKLTPASDSYRERPKLITSTFARPAAGKTFNCVYWENAATVLKL